MKHSEKRTTTGIILKDFSKTFGMSKVLHDVSFTFEAGKIIGVLGENGAGKSTLFKLLAGIYEPDSGAELIVNGQEVKLPLSATAAADLGFAFVHQDLGLAGSLTVAENIFVGGMITRFGVIDWKAQEQKVRELLGDLGVDLDPSAEIQDLTQAEKAVVAIARAVYARGRESSSLLVLDEPTANLTGVERDRLFEAMRRAAEKGTSVAFCTHRLDEILTTTDSVFILRDGHKVYEGPTSDFSSEKEIATHILGRDLAEQLSQHESHIDKGAEPVLEVEGLSGQGVHEISFKLQPGEVLGLTGLAGAGHDDVADLVIGSITASAGSVKVDNVLVKASSPVAATRAGLGMLPADRKKRSGIMTSTIAENLTLVSFQRFVKHGLIDQRAERASVLQAMERFDVRPMGDPDRELATLSGGNQQKVLIAKWAEMKGMKCLILHEPTQGVDVGAKQAILEHITRIASEGVAVILISSEHEELSHLCDRVLVMRGGTVRSELRAATAKQITEQCYIAA